MATSGGRGRETRREALLGGDNISDTGLVTLGRDSDQSPGVRPISPGH